MSTIEDLIPEHDTEFPFRRRQSEPERRKREFDSNGTKPATLPTLGVGSEINEKYLIHVRKLISNISKDKSRYRDELEEMEQMGEGSFGKVFRCRSKLDNKLYAVKQVLLTALDTEDKETRTLTCSREEPEIVHKPEGEEHTSSSEESSPGKRNAILNGRKLMESFIMNQLEHPNVIRYYSSWIEILPTVTKGNNPRPVADKFPVGPEANGMLYIQMELCECRSLKRWLAQRDKDGKIEPLQNLAIFAQIVYGLHYIHKSGYCHRDIKPANILLNPYVSSPAFLVAHAHHHRRGSTPSLSPFSRTRSPIGQHDEDQNFFRTRSPIKKEKHHHLPNGILLGSSRSSRAILSTSALPPSTPQIAIAPSAITTTTSGPIPPTLARVTSVPAPKRRLRSDAAPVVSSLLSTTCRSRTDSINSEKLEEETSSGGSVETSERGSTTLQSETEKDKEIQFETTQAYALANYIAKIGDFGLATKLPLDKSDPEEHSRPASPKEISPVSSPPPAGGGKSSQTNSKDFQIHFNSGGGSTLQDDGESKVIKAYFATPKISPDPRLRFGSDSPPILPCAQQHAGHDGDEPRPCRRPGLRTCGIGTTLYAAPEQLYSHYYGTPVDVFSLGLILVELCCTAESRKDRYKILKRARKGLLPPSLVETFPQEAELIQKMLQLNPLDRPSTAEILRHPLLSYFVVPPRCSTPVLRRSNSRLTIPSPLARSRSGRLGLQTPDRSLDCPPPEATKSRLNQTNLIEKKEIKLRPPTGNLTFDQLSWKLEKLRNIELSSSSKSTAYQENMGKSRRSLLRPTEHPPPLTLTTSAHSSFTFDKEEARSFNSIGACSCSEDVEKLQTTINAQKDTLDKMVTRMQSYEEQLKSKDTEIQSLKSSLQQLHILFERMQNQLSGGQK